MPEALTRHLQRAGALLLHSCSLETLSIWLCHFVWRLCHIKGPWGCVRRILYNDIHCLYTRCHGQQTYTGFRTLSAPLMYVSTGLQSTIWPCVQSLCYCSLLTIGNNISSNGIKPFEFILTVALSILPRKIIMLPVSMVFYHSSS